MSVAEKKKGKDLLVVKNGIAYTISQGRSPAHHATIIVPGALTGKPSAGVQSFYSTHSGLVKGLTSHKTKKNPG